MGLQHLGSTAGSFGTYGAKVSKAPTAHPFGGQRAGAKSGAKISGVKKGGVLNTLHPNGNAGRSGGNGASQAIGGKVVGLKHGKSGGTLGAK